MKMGVRGLTTYIEENSTAYLKPHELSNCYLVIDGNGVSCSLYGSKMKSHSAFGGDYDEYYKVVRDFFLLLKKCKITPIVFFDGGHERGKIKTIVSRANGKISILKEYLNGFSTTVLFPLFLKRTFCDVVDDLGVFYVQSDMEADNEIAAVARALNCPVLSQDSDFYIYDVLYTPFSFLQLEPNKCSNSNNYFLKCMVYDVANFLNAFTGLDKSLLPVLATLLGNDYINCSLFQKFYGHVMVRKAKNKSYTQRKIHAVLHWLKSENVQSAIKSVLIHVENKKQEEALLAIKKSIQNYTSNAVSESAYNKLTNRLGNIGLTKRDLKIDLPPELLQLYYQCKINTFVIDLLNLGLYFTPLQPEIINRSSHFMSKDLINDLIIILTPYARNKNFGFKLYFTIHSHYTPIKLNLDESRCAKNLCLHSVLKENKEVRLNWLCRIVDVDENELKIVSCNNSWSIFIMAFIYWIRELKSEVTLAHIHSLLLMAIVNEVAQKCVGYFRNLSKFMKSKGKIFKKLEGTPVQIMDVEGFEEMLKGVTLYEKLLIQNVLIPYRRTPEKESVKDYSVILLHAFSCFQSILYHIMELNALLNFPLPHLKIGDFYSGTLLFNFFTVIKANRTVEKFGCALLKDTPNLAKIYTYLCEGLAKFFPKGSVTTEKRKKKKKKRKKSFEE